MSYTVETTHIGDGITKLFGFDFEVALTDSVNVEVDSTAVPFTVIGSSVELTSAPSVGAAVRIYRSTNLDTLRYQYQLGAPFLPSTVDANNLQLLYALQESQFNVSRFYSSLLRVPTTDNAIDALPTAAARAGKILSFDASGQPTVYMPASESVTGLTADLINSTDADKGAALVGFDGMTVAEALADRVLSADLASSADPLKGSGMVGYLPAGSGAVGTDVQSKLRETCNAVTDFGADNTGTSNATTALFNFFTHCINTGTPGRIPAGRYLVTAGVLSFDTPFTDAPWPDISTDGYRYVTFLRADATDAPFITLTNGTATGNSGKYWLGGSIGGITFSQNGMPKSPNQHGISLRGVWGTRFGWLRANDQGGSCVYMPESLYNTTNPDPYANTFIEFQGIEANRCSRYALENRNYLGFNGCRVKNLRVIECLLGGLYGFGTENVIDIVSMGSVKGWAFDDGTHTAATGGAPLRFYVGMAELDDVQYGIRLNRCQYAEFRGVRFNHRYNFNSALNNGEGYWPRKAVEVASGTSSNVGNVRIEAVHRIEAGGTKAAIGTFYDGSNNGNVTGLALDQRILDAAGLGFTDGDLFTGVSLSSNTLLTKNGGTPIADRRTKVAALVRSSVSYTVTNSGYATAAAKVVFDSELYDLGGYYDTANSWFVVPYTGIYRVSGKICLAAAVGTRVRVGFAVDTAGVVTTMLNSIGYQISSAEQHYTADGVVYLTAGQRLFLMADQNTAGVIHLSAPISPTADLTWSVEAL